MNITITMDDNGNPIFSQEGNIDMNSFIKDILSDNNDIKKVFQDKFKSLADSIKIDQKKVSDSVVNGISELFKFSASYKSDVQKNIKSNIDKLFSNLSLDEKSINKNINDIFSYNDKNKSFKSIFDKIESSISDKLSFTDKIQPSKIKAKEKLDIVDKIQPSKIKAKEKLDIVDKIQNVRINDISPNVFKPIILDVNVMDMGEGLIKYISSVLSEDFSEKNYAKLSPLFSNFSSPITGDQADTTFEESGITPVKIMDISPDLLEKLNLNKLEKEPEKEDEKKGGILGMLSNILGLGGVASSIKSLGSAVMSTMASVFKLPSAALRFATNPLTLLIAGLAWGVFDGIKATLKADEWGVGKISAFLGGFVSGNVNSMLGNMGKWALIGAGVGIVGGPIGSLIGGLIGGILGAIFNAIGAEKMAQSFSKFGSWVSEQYNQVVEKLSAFFVPIFEELSETWNEVKSWYDTMLMPAIDEFKAEIQPVIERIKTFFTDKLIPDLKNLFGLFEPLFELMSNSVSEYIWPTIKNIGSFIGEKLVVIFEDLAYYIDIMFGTFENMYDKITWFLGKLRDAVSWIGDKLGRIVSWWSGEKKDEENSDIDALESEKVLVQKLKDHKLKLIEELAKVEAESDQAAIDLAKSRLEHTDKQIVKYENRINQNEPNQKQSQKISGKDVTLDYKNPNSIQIQLDENDKMYNFKTGAAFAKSGGALDEAIHKVSEKIEQQMKTSEALNSMFETYLNLFNQYNNEMFQMLPKLVEGSKPVPQIPAESSVPDGYIRDPVYEFRMKARERLYV